MALGSLRGVLFFYERNIEMKDLLISIAQGLVEEPDAVTVTVDEPDDEGVTVYHLHVSENDMGRVIGKHGKIAKAIRSIVKSASYKLSKKVVVEIK